MKKHLYAFLVLALPTFAAGHAMLDHSLPAVGSTVAAAPKELKIWFDQPVDPAKSSVDVVDASGKSVASAALRGEPGDDTILLVPLVTTSGKISVKWSEFCPPCGHTTHGSFVFTIGR